MHSVALLRVSSVALLRVFVHLTTHSTMGPSQIAARSVSFVLFSFTSFFRVSLFYTCLFPLRMFFFLYWRSSIFAGIDCMDDSLKSIGGSGGCTSSIFARGFSPRRFEVSVFLFLQSGSIACASHEYLVRATDVNNVRISKDSSSVLIWRIIKNIPRYIFNFSFRMP